MYKANSALILTEVMKNRGLHNTSHVFMFWHRAREKTGRRCALWHKKIKSPAQC